MTRRAAMAILLSASIGFGSTPLMRAVPLSAPAGHRSHRVVSTATTVPGTARSAGTSAKPKPRPAIRSKTPEQHWLATPAVACIRQHESTDNYRAPGGGAYQIRPVTLRGATGLTWPAEDYSPAVQDAAAFDVYEQALHWWGDGWRPWLADFASCHL